MNMNDKNVRTVYYCNFCGTKGKDVQMDNLTSDFEFSEGIVLKGLTRPTCPDCGHRYAFIPGVKQLMKLKNEGFKGKLIFDGKLWNEES